MVTTGQILTLRVEKPAVGGRMIARHEGQVVLVDNAIPEELVSARIEKIGRGVAYATTVEILEPHGSRRAAGPERACGGNTYAHIAYATQLDLKRDILRDALQRIGRIQVDAPIPIAASEETGYRMRARLHVVGGRFGFYKEGTHELCNASTTGQLLPETMVALEALWARVTPTPLGAVTDMELAENVAATERAVNLELPLGARGALAAPIDHVPGITGLSYSHPAHTAGATVFGEPYVTDTLSGTLGGAEVAPVRLRRHTRAFFQGNRYLLAELVQSVLGAVPSGPVMDLYAGVGLFAVSLAEAGRGPVVAVEGDRISGQDLEVNAARYTETLQTRRTAVESFLASAVWSPGTTVVIDPPRTGASPEALKRLLATPPARIVYVSCDVATLARDLRGMLASGYVLGDLRAFDMFPNTAHVETMAVLTRG